MAEKCLHCKHGFMGSDIECVNGVLIDIDEFTEGWQTDVLYPPAPCHPLYCVSCKGSGEKALEGGAVTDCADCEGSGYRGGASDCQERLQAAADRP